MPLLRAGPSPGSVTNNSNGLADATLRPPYDIPRRSTAVSFDLPGPNSKTRKISEKRREKERERGRERDEGKTGKKERYGEEDYTSGKTLISFWERWLFLVLCRCRTISSVASRMCILCVYILYILRMTNTYVYMYVRMHVTLAS